MQPVPRAGCQALERRLHDLQAENERLRRQLDEATRTRKRQADPFAKGPPADKPEKPGRNPGKDYGTKAHRQPPTPDQIDEVREAPLPDRCPDCGGALRETHIAQQFQVEIPRKPIHRQFNIHIGRCSQCHRRVQGRHPLQTSDALSAAAAQLGPDAQAAVVELNKQAGLSHGKVVRSLESLFGIPLSRGGSIHTVLRAASRCEPVYDDIRPSVGQADWVVPDETGWRVGARPAWLHAMLGQEATAYAIDPNHGGTVAEAILGLDYGGTMIHDGWLPYDQFEGARHQHCLNHLLRRADQMEAAATRGAVCFPRRVAELLRAGLDLRDRHEAGEVSRHGLAVACGHLENQLSELIFPPKRTRPTSAWPSTCGFTGATCSLSCVSRAWTRPTGVRSWRFASGSSCARCGAATGPGLPRAVGPDVGVADLLATGAFGLGLPASTPSRHAGGPASLTRVMAGVGTSCRIARPDGRVASGPGPELLHDLGRGRLIGQPNYK